MTFSALPLMAANNECVGPIEGMPVLAVRLTRAPRDRAISPQGVLATRYNLKVSRIHASHILAQVVNCHVIGDMAPQPSVKEAVGVLCDRPTVAAPSGDRSVPALAAAPKGPVPARVRPLSVDLKKDWYAPNTERQFVSRIAPSHVVLPISVSSI